jgi:hypothetical protein
MKKDFGLIKLRNKTETRHDNVKGRLENYLLKTIKNSGHP